MQVSFVILNFNRKEELLLTVAKTKAFITEANLSYEIVVVDNASSDNSVDEIKQQHPDVVVVPRKINNGVAGWNDGFKIAKGEYFIVLDDDSNIESGLTEAIQYLDENSGIGILALNVSGGGFQTLQKWGWKDKQDCPGFIGCGAIIRKKVFNDIGGFAEWLFIYTHEFEYGIRCLDAGYSIHYFEHCHVTHRVSIINRSIKRLKIFSIRNEMAIIYKYFPVNRWKYISRIGINNLKVIKRGEWQAAWFSILGMVKFLQMRHSITPTPVSIKTQTLFTESFTTTKPAFDFIKRAVLGLFVPSSLRGGTTKQSPNV